LPAKKEYTGSENNNHCYDYIIAGAGCAGLSLLMRILQEPSLQHKKILVIDAEPKTKNDRTWCFWEKEAGLFEPVVYHHWQQLSFQSTDYSSNFSIAPYTYKLIRGIDLYTYVLEAAKAFPNIVFQYEKVLTISTEGENAKLTTNQAIYYADYLFNSIRFEEPVGKYRLLQHFKGILIETEIPVFNPAIATFMDFTVSQHTGTTFMYVLPLAANQALIEYTLFTPEVLPASQYDKALENYIRQQLHIEKYTVLHEEYGIIPMTDQQYKQQEGRIMYIGTAGGQTKASSGFTFQFIQKITAAMVRLLKEGQAPIIKRGFSYRKYQLYDHVLLNVLVNKKMKGDALFASIFKKNSPAAVLEFLDNDSSLATDLKIMASVPLNIFLPATLQELFT
jgi:lycopene beta-cyclase